MKSCPTPAQLEQLLDGLIDGPVAERLSQHVDSCPSCQHTLDELTAADFSSITSARVAVTLAEDGTARRTQFLEELKSWPLSSAERGSRGRQVFTGKVALPEVPGYDILRELGRGGIGVVYLARQTSLNRLVALKVLRSGPHANAEERGRFHQEAEVVARLRHPNIVHVYEVGEHNGVPFLALEYVEGGSLGDRLRGDPQPIAGAVALVETVARAIDHAHQAGLVHRDLKPANILVQPRSPDSGLADCFSKITDFGLAKRLDDPNQRTASGDIIGTPSYMAPEQAGGRGQVGPATDVYALGAILYELLTGRPPFKGATAVDTVVQLIHQEPVRPGSLRPDLPRDLETICLACLSKEPSRRYPSAAALADDLERFRRGQPILARPVGPFERAVKWAWRHPLPATLLAVILLVALVGFLGVTWQWRTAADARDRLLVETREKEQERQQAEQARTEVLVQRGQAQAALYGSRITQSQLSWRVNDLTGARSALEACLPINGEEDRRGWEWYHLRQLYRAGLFTLEHRPGGGSGGNVAHSPKGDQLASILAGSDEGADGELCLWDAQGENLLLARSVPGVFHRLAYSPDGKRLALAGTDGSVVILDAVTGKEIQGPWKAHERAISDIVYSPDGGTIATASWDNTVRLWWAVNGKPGAVLRGHTDRVQSVCFHPGGKLLASASWDRSVRLWAVTAGGEGKELLGHKSPVFGVAFSPDGKYLASGGQNGNVRIWQVEGSRPIQSVTSLTGAVLCLAFSPDGRYLAYGGSDATTRVWDFESGTQEANFRGHTAPVEGLSFSPDGQVLVSCCPDEGAVTAWDMTRNQETGLFARTEADLEALAFARGGRALLTLTRQGRLQAWDRATGLLQEEHDLLPEPLGPSRSAVAAFSSSGQRVALGRLHGGMSVRVMDTQTARKQAEFPIKGRLACLAFSPDEAVVGVGLSNDDDHFVLIFDVESGELLKQVAIPARPYALEFRDQKWLAWGGTEGASGVLHWPTGRSALLPPHKGAVLALAFSPDGTLLASAGQEDRAVRLFQLEAPAEGQPTLTPLKGIDSPLGVCGLAFSPDGKRLAGCTRDLVKVWDHKARLEMLTLRGSASRYWDGPYTQRIAFSSDGAGLAGTNWDQSVSLWEAEDANTERAETFRRQAVRLAEERAAFWHLQEAEQCLRFRNLDAARFHLKRLPETAMPGPLQVRREAVEKFVAAGGK